MGRANVVTDYIKRYDSQLYCKDREGKLCIFRKGQRIESYDVDGVTIDFVRPAPHFVCALTDDWTTNGKPVEWGLMPILERLQSHNLWERDIVKELQNAYDKKEASKSRELDNHIESYLKDNRKAFAKATDDVLTHSMSKTDKRKLGEENGNC